MMQASEQLEFRRLLRSILAPPLQITPSEWANLYFWLSREYSSQPGPLTLWPFQNEPLDCLGPNHPSKLVVLMCASQLMKTQIMMAWIAFLMHLHPGPILSVFPRDKDAESFSKKRLAPMIRDISVLRGIVADPKSRDSGNTISEKLFRGGSWTGVGAGSAQNLASLSVRYSIEEELDRFPSSAGDEGDPELLVEQRLTNYAANSKSLKISTPTIDNHSRIQRNWKLSDQRKYHVPCPHCGGRQVIEFERLKWPTGNPSNVGLECLHCNRLLQEAVKWEMLVNGRWIAEVPGSPVPGFHISQLYSPIKTWAAIVDQHQRSKDEPKSNQVFLNTVLAKVLSLKGEAPNWEIVKSRADDYEAGTVPFGVIFLTAGIDVQRDRIEVLIYGWGRKRERWVVEHIILEGRTDGDQVYRDLTEVVERTWRHPGGADMRLMRYAIDSGDGVRTADVYQWALTRPASRCMVIKGAVWDTGIIGSRTPISIKASGQKRNKGIAVWRVNVGMLKMELYTLLRVPKEQPIAGRVHYPKLDDEFFKQLTAEELVPKPNARFDEHPVWTKTRPRNEILDLTVYARAAHALLGADSWSEDRWVEMERELNVVQATFDFEARTAAAHTVPETVVEKPIPGPVVSGTTRQGSSWIPKRSGWL